MGDKNGRKIYNGSSVRVTNKTDTYGDVHHAEPRPDGKTEYHIDLDAGGRTTALGENLEVIDE